MPIISDTIYNSNFNGKSNSSKNGFVCKIFTEHTYINSFYCCTNQFMLFIGSLKMDHNCNQIRPYSQSASYVLPQENLI